MKSLGKIGLQNNSGGNGDSFIHKEFSGRIPYCIILALIRQVSKVIKFPTTTVLKSYLPKFVKSASSSSSCVDEVRHKLFAEDSL